jgi:PAS domain S-box-containing protein
MSLRAGSDQERHLIAESIPHLVWVAGPDGATQYINRRWQAYTGVSVEQAMGWDWQYAIHPEDLPQALHLWRDALRTGQPYEAEFRLRRADGEYRWHIDRALPLRDTQGQITHWFGTCTDTEDQKRAEDQLLLAHRRAAESLALLDTFIDNAPVGFALVDRDLRYARVNAALAAINGLSPADHLGRHVWEVLPGLWPQLEPRYRQLLQGDGSVGEVEVSGETAAAPGWTRHWLVNHYPVRTGEELLGIGVIVNEVTERKRLEDQFLHSQKLEAVGRLAGGVAHDFNNLLTVINCYAAMLLQDLGADAPGAASARAILEAGERAAHLTQQLLAFGRKDLAAPRVLDLNAAVREAEAMLRRVLGEDVALTTDLQPGLGRVRADPTHVQQVVMNLAVNARDAMPRGGRLSLATRDVQREPGPYVLLAVSDTGCGMTEEVKAHLFEPFFTTKEVGQGTGLGLSTVYGIVKRSGGHIEVESQQGSGTTIRVYLPRVEEAPAPETPNGAGPVPRGSETVLLAEDEGAVRALGREVLRSSGYAVLEASDGTQALWLAGEHCGPIDLLVTDVVMPGLDGRGLAERLQALRPGIKVLYMSGYTDDAVVRHGVSRDEVQFLQKPFSPAALARKVREVLDQVARGEPYGK